jgi:molybdenum cofactor synthesis domain-containing protein
VKQTASTGRILSVNTSEKKGTVKKPAASITIDENGVREDAHAGPWHRQVSLLSSESIARFAASLGRRIEPGEFAENITTVGLDLSTVSLLDTFSIEGVELEVTQIGKECHGEGCAIFREVGKCVMPKEGIFTRVLSTGRVNPDDVIGYSPRTLRIMVLTLSDRASRGEYEDRSGPRVRELLESFFTAEGRRASIDNRVLPDDAALLKETLQSEIRRGSDIVITTGGTGIGPRDITPDVVTEVADKLIPGVMDYIRIKYGEAHPNALLTRSIAAVTGRTLIYSLPGSVRAVTEYLEEIVKTINHTIYTVNGLDTH